jgi:hypothetical protein
LVSRMPNGFIVVAAKPVEEVVEEVNRIILSHLSEKVRRRLKLKSTP